MAEETKHSIEKNKEIIDVIEFPEKTEDAKQNILRLIVGNNAIGSGFLCKIYIEKDKPMPALITCYHVVDEDYMKNNEILYFSYLLDDVNTEKVLDLQIKRLIYQDKELDITIIEIKEEDNLDIYSFLEMDTSIIVNNPELVDKKDKKVYSLHYPEGVEKVKYSQGEVADLIDNIYLSTNNWTEPGSSGAPIINYENNYVIGIHSGSDQDEKDRTGLCTILNYAIKKFSENKSEEIKSKYKRLYPKSDEMYLDYLIPNKKKEITLFNNKFVKKNKSLCTFIYNGYEKNIIQKFEINNITKEDKNKGEIRIILKGINYIRDMDYMLYQCDELKKIIATGTDFSNVETMRSAFEQCKNLEEITNTSNWRLKNVISLRGLFYKCPKLKDVPGIEKWDPKNLKDKLACFEMFKSCLSIKASVIEKVESWKNVPEDIKKEAKKDINMKSFLSSIGKNTKALCSDLFNKKK